MKQIEDIIFGKTAKLQFEAAEGRIFEIMGSRKMLYDLENHFDLDKSLEEMHEAKLSCDLVINILERTKAELTQNLRRTKETLKEERLNLAIVFENSFKKQEHAFTTKELEKRMEKHILAHLKDKEEEHLDLLDMLDIVGFETNKFNKIRENVDDVYMTIKKKYDLLIKRNVT